jgi:hypothetical protein
MHFTRTAFLAVFAGLALLSAGCESNNKGKIVGKWSAGGGLLMMEFTSDGQFVMSGAASSRGTYTLGAGDTVDLKNLSPPMDGHTASREKITITGDTLLLANPKGNPTTFTRVKD